MYFFTRLAFIYLRRVLFVEMRTRPLSTFLHVYCNYSKSFWTEVIKWLGDQGVKIQRLSLKDILFGVFSCEDELYVNHILLLARQYLHSCRCKKTLHRIRIFIAKTNIAYQLETMIAKSNVDRLPVHYSKWGKYVNILSA